ncbi:NADH:flavin oxidoreductase [Psychroserpens sp. XS_ASV72]|uniref:NADH:flavin oxidoreductase n=1 Tax=Psychroserpens sp. XS_ASV72 TaxID=3241293 RepID=UPI0035115589
MSDLNQPLTFPCGKTMPNRFMLAPMTNTQSNEDGTLSNAEYNWLTMRSKGGFGLTMTCASHVQANGKGFPGQLGIFDDVHIEGHKKLAQGIKTYGSLAVVQLHHAGMRSPEDLIEGSPVSASAIEKYNTKALSLKEVEQLRDDFIAAALRAKISGYDGVEVHGAHGYIISQFLSSEINKRTDSYGGTLENRARLLFEIVKGIRQTCGSDFLLGVRLSPERFGMQLTEIKTICKQLANDELIDFLDISLWDTFKMPEEEAHQSKTLLKHFTTLDLKQVKLTVAGKITTAKEVQTVLSKGVDFVTIGRAAILHYDFPKQVMAHSDFKPIATPVSKSYLNDQGLSDPFIEYMKRWPDFVED